MQIQSKQPSPKRNQRQVYLYIYRFLGTRLRDGWEEKAACGIQICEAVNASIHTVSLFYVTTTRNSPVRAKNTK
jgi:hypothetical protein